MNFLTAEKASKLDQELMSTPGFSLDQLMELAGLSVACSIAEKYNHGKKILIVCGPGNNGGDGLVASRHLHHFGFDDVDLFYPKRTDKKIFKNLVHQIEQLNINLLEKMPSYSEIKSKYELIVDSIFGFSFKGEIRPPFDTIIENMISSKVPIISVDVPSGW
eukprot:CAMPEP_0171461930 /NCGR_PEP_ID=MMETSP0945-20130129/6175_1 /TAXON_ID=109269 /ORGANISM="Vaucheria litorea, Strain CCMP2940" /LENGTH=161 /DNA_ID=CAMNT_0011988363 /DNA_START=100 /DNA_END=582 /DNA_ORIENTATION=+